MTEANPILVPEEVVSAETVASAAAQVREAQRFWSERSIAERCRVVKKARGLLAEAAEELAGMSAELRGRPRAETLSAEMLPLVEAHLFVEQSATGLLSPVRLGQRGRPLWLTAVKAELHREPRGVVLVIGPSNYPLLLPGVQILQALAAGNGVLFKPAPGTEGVAQRLRDFWIAAGLAPHLFQLLPSRSDSVHHALQNGIDFVVLTGSETAGKAVAEACAARGIPSVMELSGCDPVIICEDADVTMASQALAFGLRMNGGATCIAPRRVLVARRLAERLEASLVPLVERGGSLPAPESLHAKLRDLLRSAAASNLSVLAGGESPKGLELPLVISGGVEGASLLADEMFAPVLTITFVDSDDEAVRLASGGGYALGATIFSRDEGRARRIARQLNAGVVVINDMIVPTADPRLPFGGRGRSGFGVTRGGEGLLTMTVPKVITVTAGKFRPHFEPVGDVEASFFTGYIQARHGVSSGARRTGFRKLWQGAMEMFRRR